MIVQPTKVSLKECTIAGVPFVGANGENLIEYFNVHSIRIYEDICKAYFTGQLTIEDQMNVTDDWIQVGAVVDIAWTSEPNSNSYQEKFRVYSFESKPKENDKYGGMLITINLIGDEYFNDVQNTVIQNFKNIPATQAAAQIHNQFIAENGGIQVSASKGPIGLDNHPHQVINLKPIKAIHDLLDKAVSISVDTSAFVYFRNKPGYVIAPLQELLETAAIVERFAHKPGQTAVIEEILVGYNNIIHFRPMAPPSQETAAGIRNSELDGLLKTNSFFDAKTGNILNNLNGSALSAGLAKLGALAKTKSPFGARFNYSTINEDRQPRTVDKLGPGNYKSKEEAFIASLGYSKKYWITVPMQSGMNVTVGKRIDVVYPVGADPKKMQQKTLFVVRLVHELQFKTPGQNRYEPAQGSTDMYCVDWN